MKVIHVEILKDCEVDGRIVKEGKKGGFLEETANRLIEEGNAVLIEYVDDILDVLRVGQEKKGKKKSSKKFKDEGSVNEHIDNNE